ncbi:MAG TPA: hypothetical protein VH817_00820 [Thermoleophilaceae bacterium]|jgi:hypothetical protein
MPLKPLLWIAALAIAAVLGLSAQASAATVKGTVVHANKSAHTFVVAGRSGRMTVVSSRRSARAGSVVRVSGRKLKSGALRAKRVRVRGHRRHARLRGLITWANSSSHTVAANGASLLVNGNGAPVGTPVQDDVTINDNGDLDEDHCHHMGNVPGQIELEGVVLSTDTTAQTITISADDDFGEAEASNHGGDQGDDNQGDDDQGENDENPTIVVHVPDASAFTVGDKVELIVTGPADDGSFTLVSVDEQKPAGENNSGPGSNNSGPGHGEDEGDDSGHGGGDD